MILPSETTIDADYLNQLKGEGDIQVGDKTYSLKNYPVTVTDGTATPIIPSTPEPTATPKPTDTPEPNSESESTSEPETNSASDAFPSEAPKVEIKDEVVETLSEILKDENLKKEDLKVEVSNVEPDKAKDEIAKLIEENESLKNLLESLNIGNKKDKNSDTSNKSDKNIEDSSKSDDKKGTDKDASKQDEKKGTDKTEDKSGDKEGTDKTEDKSGDKEGTDKTEDKSDDKKGTDKTEDKSDDKKGTDKNVSEPDDKESADKTSKLEEALDSLNILGAIKIHFFAGNKTINHFGNASITISIPVISTKSLPKNPLVIAISDDGRVSYMKGKIKGNQVQVKTNHVTTFIVTDLDYNEHIEAIKKVEFISPTTVIPLGKKVSFTLDVSGYNTKNITWVTTKKNRAVVKKNKGKLTALIKGKTVGKDTIRIKVKGKVVAEIKVTVAKRKTKTK